jgi:hypothetical protein
MVFETFLRSSRYPSDVNHFERLFGRSQFRDHANWQLNRHNETTTFVFEFSSLPHPEYRDSRQNDPVHLQWPGLFYGRRGLQKPHNLRVALFERRIRHEEIRCQRPFHIRRVFLEVGNAFLRAAPVRR